MADDDDRSRDSSSAAGPGWSDPGRPDETWAEAVAPDDISELSHDIHAYHRECRAARRRERHRTYLHRRGATPFALGIAALALVAIATALLTVMGPTTAGTAPAADRLATTSTPDGQVGGRVPAIALGAPNGTTVNSVSLRPGAFVLLSPLCDCDKTVISLDQAAGAGDHSPLFVVAPSAYPSPGADSLQGQLRPYSSVLYDQTAALRTAVGAHGLTVVLVNRDGTIFKIDRDVTDAQGLSADLVSMLSASEPAA